MRKSIGFRLDREFKLETSRVFKNRNEKFYRQIMTGSEDSAVRNIKSTRIVVRSNPFRIGMNTITKSVVLYLAKLKHLETHIYYY